MNTQQIQSLINETAQIKNLSKSIVIEAVSQALMSIIRKKIGMDIILESSYDPIDGVKVYQYKKVVEEPKYKQREISLEDAKKIEKEISLGEELGFLIEDLEISRNHIQLFKQILSQKLNQAEKDQILKEFNGKKGDLISGTIKRVEGDRVIVSIGKADGVLLKKHMLHQDEVYPKNRITAYISDVVSTRNGPEIRLSRTDHMFLVKILEREIPEIGDGLVRIVKIAREAGIKSKVVVASNEEDGVDPVQTCLGHGGHRIQSIVNDLGGEVINILKEIKEPQQMITQVIKPAVADQMLIGEHSIDLFVEEDQIGLLLGKRKSNIKLAASILGKRINLISKEKLKEKIDAARAALTQLEEISQVMAQNLINNDIFSIKDLLSLPTAKLTTILEWDDSKVENFKKKTLELLNNKTIKETPEIEIVDAYGEPRKFPLPQEHTDKDTAEKRLQDALKEFNLRR